MTDGIWITSYVLLWLTVVVLALAVVALLRQIGVLHARLAPLGAHFAGEGPPLDQPAPPVPGVDWGTAARTLVAFTSPTCEVCATLRPSIAALARQYRDVRLHTVELDGPTRPVFAAFDVRSTPYFVVVDDGGVVRGRGVANSLEQVEELLAESAVADLRAVEATPA